MHVSHCKVYIDISVTIYLNRFPFESPPITAEKLSPVQKIIIFKCDVIDVIGFQDWTTPEIITLPDWDITCCNGYHTLTCFYVAFTSTS